MMWRGAKGLLEIDGSCQWLKMWSKGGEEEEEEEEMEREIRKRMKNCFLVKQGRMHGYHTRFRLGRGCI